MAPFNTCLVHIMDATMTPSVSDHLQGKVAAANLNVSTLYCMIRRYTLFAKTLPPELNSVFEDVVDL